jgi:hypothetical protein
VSSWIKAPNSNRILFFTPEGYGGHGCGCHCVLHDAQQSIATPSRILEINLDANGKAFYRYIRIPTDHELHWLSIDYSEAKLRLLDTAGSVTTIETNQDHTKVHFRGPVCIDYTKEGMVVPISANKFRYCEGFRLKGSIRKPHCLSVHGPHRPLSAIKANSISVMRNKSEYNLRPAQICPGYFFLNCFLNISWELELDGDVDHQDTTFNWSLEDFTKDL